MKFQKGVTSQAGLSGRISLAGLLRLRRAKLYLAILAGVLTLPSVAHALPGDPVEFFVGETVVRDSNVFRISGDRDAATFLGSSEKGDTRSTTSAGLTFDVPVSRQRFQGGVSLNHNRYGRFTDLNHTDRDIRALWLWQVEDPLKGQLGFTETESLASFLNFQGRNADPLRIRRAFGNAAWTFAPNWRLQAGLAQQEQRNGLSLRQDNDLNLRSPDITLSYVTAANNSVGVSLRQDDGHYRNQQVLAGNSINNDYRQRRLGVVTDWTITGKSHISARADRVQRSYEQLSQRNYDGTTLYASYDLQATAKFSLSAVAQREISMGEDIQTSLVLIKGIALRPSFEVTDKIRLSANADYSVRDYLGDPAVALGLGSARTDRVRLLSATLSYRAMQSLMLTLSAQRELRSSNQVLTDYADSMLSIGARFAF